MVDEECRSNLCACFVVVVILPAYLLLFELMALVCVCAFNVMFVCSLLFLQAHICCVHMFFSLFTRSQDLYLLICVHVLLLLLLLLFCQLACLFFELMALMFFLNVMFVVCCFRRLLFVVCMCFFFSIYAQSGFVFIHLCACCCCCCCCCCYSA